MSKAKPMSERAEGVLSGFKWAGVTAFISGVIFKRSDMILIGCADILAAYAVELKEKVDYAYDKKLETEVEVKEAEVVTE